MIAICALNKALERAELLLSSFRQCVAGTDEQHLR